MNNEIRPKSKKVDFVGDAILNYIRENNGQIFLCRNCAESLGLHYNTVQKRIAKFRAEGIIKVVGNKCYEVAES